MKNLLIILGLMASVTAASATNIPTEKFQNNGASIAETSHHMPIEIGGEDKDKSGPRP